MAVIGQGEYRNETDEQTVDELIRDTKKLQNRALEQDIKLRKTTLFILFAFLGLETVVVFLYAFWQATGWASFKLEEWSFKLLTTVTIIQITYMLQVAVKYLFPDGNKT